MAQGHCPAHTPYLAGCPDCQRINAARKLEWRRRNGREGGPRPKPLDYVAPEIPDDGTRRTYGPRYDALIAAAADAAVRPLGRMKLGGRVGGMTS